MGVAAHREQTVAATRTASGFALFLLAATASACGPVLYSVNALEATQIVEEARQAGAPSAAPYEYYFAQAHLDKAREEAGEANYQAAHEYSRIAAEFGTRARDIARRRGRESGR